MSESSLPVSYAVESEVTSPKWAAAFAAGCGGRATHAITELQPGPMASFGTPTVWPLFAQAQREGRDWYYGDHGYFRRGRYYRVSKNAYQPSGMGHATSARFAQLHVDTTPQWKTDGSTIVLCPNSPVYMEYHTGVKIEQWLGATLGAIAAASDRPVRLRWKKDKGERPLRVDLETAWLVVSYSSASAVEALAAGIPVCTLAPWASTAHMGITDLAQIESPIYPSIDERDQFLFNLAAQQWTLDEMEHGDAWRALCDRS